MLPACLLTSFSSCGYCRSLCLLLSLDLGLWWLSSLQRREMPPSAGYGTDGPAAVLLLCHPKGRFALSPWETSQLRVTSSLDKDFMVFLNTTIPPAAGAQPSRAARSTQTPAKVPWSPFSQTSLKLTDSPSTSCPSALFLLCLYMTSFPVCGALTECRLHRPNYLMLKSTESATAPNYLWPRFPNQAASSLRKSSSFGDRNVFELKSDGCIIFSL